MNGGGEVDGKRDDQGPIIRSGTNKFGRAISRVFVAQMCESVGFQAVNESALDSLAGIVIRYVSDLGKTANFHANLAGRTECNVFDVIQGLVDLGSSQVVSETRNDCIISSGPIKELEEYVLSAEEIPFAQTVPQFPVIRGRKMIPSFSQMGETPSSSHIPVWLPAFPDPHTYIQTPVWNERGTDPRTDMIELARQRRKAERSLLSLQQRLVCNGSLVAATSAGDLAEPDEVGKSDFLKIENSILVKPLQDDERNLLPVDVHAKLPGDSRTEKRASLLETFAPAIEAMKDGLDSGSDGDKLLPQKRKPIFLELKGGKKVFGESLDLRIQNKAAARTSSWFEREDEKDDKKRRVEFILRKSMENQLELPQL